LVWLGAVNLAYEKDGGGFMVRLAVCFLTCVGSVVESIITLFFLVVAVHFFVVVFPVGMSRVALPHALVSMCRCYC
jgi:hypothetical protein